MTPPIPAPVKRGVCGTCVPPCGRKARLYPSGWSCAQSTPAARHGRAEPPTTPNQQPEEATNA